MGFFSKLFGESRPDFGSKVASDWYEIGCDKPYLPVLGDVGSHRM
jgi:hypothetical protein